MIELRHIIDSKREVLRRETFSRTPVNYSEGMAEDRKHSKKCTFYTLRFGCSFAAVNTIKPQLL